MKRSFQEIMEQATREMREVLEQETGEDGAGQWDPDAWEEEVIRFTRQLGRRMVQTWAEVKAEQAKAQDPFVPGAGALRQAQDERRAPLAPVAAPVAAEHLRTD